MPISTTIFLYSISIFAGAVLVVYGLASGTGRKPAPPAHGRSGAARDLSTETAEVVVLRFIDEELPLEDSLQGVSRRARRRFFTRAGAGENSDDAEPARFRRIVKVFFRMLTRRHGGCDEPGTIERPVASSIHLDARITDAAAETPELGKPAAGE